MGCEDGSCCGRSKNANAIIIPGTDDHDTPWKFYNHLIAGIPEDILVTGSCLGTNWCYLEAECGMGVSFTTSGGARIRNYGGEVVGLALRDVAELSKSWNFAEASIGIAALNAWYASEEKVKALGAILDDEKVATKKEGTGHNASIFDVYRDRLVGKKVTVIGHFPHIERIAEVAELTVLERNCTSTLDTPDPACEYVLPSQDYVFMTGVTIINKTAPRLFDLAKNAVTVLTGPSVIPSAFLFKWDVDVLAGSFVADAEKTRRMVEQGAGMMFDGGLKMFHIEKK